MNQYQISSAYARCVKVIASCRTLGQLFSAINLVKNFQKNLPSAYLWMIAQLNDQLQKKKKQLIERRINGWIETKKAK